MAKAKGESFSITSGGEQVSRLNMNLFGIPHQLPKAVDPRIGTISTKLGKNFVDNFIIEAPVLTLIPGKPKYLSSDDEKTKRNTSVALIEAAEGNFSSASLKQLMKDNTVESMRLYDFERDYGGEDGYMSYVNVLCRAGAAFLDLDDTITVDGTTWSMQKFDWRMYKWNEDAYNSLVQNLQSTVSALKNGTVTKPNTKGLGKKAANKKIKKWKKKLKAQQKANKKALVTYGVDTGDVKEYQKSTDKTIMFESWDQPDPSITDNLVNYHYVQFYVDPESTSTDTMSNSTGESSMKGLFAQGESMYKDIAFMANSGGIDIQALSDQVAGGASGIAAGVDKIIGDKTKGIGNLLTRLTQSGAQVLKGENIIIPDIYQSSSYQKSYNITIHLRSPYGSKFAWFLNVYVPLMHLLALVLPKQGSANSYASPFLVKGQLEGQWTVNLGIVTDLTITKDTESFSVDGLPLSVDVTLNIQDLYADLSITSGSSPIMFLNNSSLVEYLAMTCGMSLNKPNLEKKFSLVMNTMMTAFLDIPTNIASHARESIDNLISSYLTIGG